MSEVRKPFQIKPRRILEAIAWLACGSAAFGAAWGMLSGMDRISVPPTKTFDYAIGLLFSFLICFPGAAFGAALGSLAGRRFWPAIIGLILWVVAWAVFPTVQVSR